MNRLLIIVLGLLIISCTSNNGKQADQINSNDTLVGERIDGPANIRDTINGQQLFSLYDNTLVGCGPLQNDWYDISLMMDIDTSEFGITKLEKGRKIMVNGQEVGEILTDLIVSTSKSHNIAWAYLFGYTYKDNIKPETIIENVLNDLFIGDIDPRTLKDFKPFIDNFKLLNSNVDGLDVYYYYEPDYASPMWRIALVFQSNKLIAVLHSRPLAISGTTSYNLDKDVGCMIFNDVENPSAIVNVFNNIFNSFY